MCGFLFGYDESAQEIEFSTRASYALDCLKHRGPDESNLIDESSYVIGHQRLSILDLESSRQPMEDVNRRFVLAYNGEVYNYKSLRGQLEGKWEFRSNGDTEVVLAGLVLYGEDFFEHMEGMWALALWDKKTRSLLLSRDRMGKKPLYYKKGTRNFFCSSEMPSLLRLLPERCAEDLDSSADYFRFGYYLPGKTAYEGVQEVLPGHFLRWSVNEEIKEKPFWKLNIGEYSGSRKKAGLELHDRMIEAVEKRLVSDVEVGAFLSGGIDSSLIVAILTKELNINIKTFTIGFDNSSYDERKFARMVAEAFSTQHFENCLVKWDESRLTRLLFDNVGQPFSDSSLLPTSLVSELAARHVKVSLSGDGGDELFGGYQRYQARTLLRWYTRLPRFIRNNFKKAIRCFPEPMVHHSHSLFKKAHLFLDITDRQLSETPYVAPLLYSDIYFQKLAPSIANYGHSPPNIPEESSPSDVMRMMAADALIYLPQDILAKVDRASMAYSLEARAPFLDKDLIELAFSLPIQWHRGIFSGKNMLRRAFSDTLPKVLWRRRKQGFAVPVHQWFRGNLGNELLEMNNEVSTPLDKGHVKTMLNMHQAGHRDHGYRLWNIYVYLLWKSKYPWLL